MTETKPEEITEATAQLIKIQTLIAKAEKDHASLMSQINNARANFEKYTKDTQSSEKRVKEAEEQLVGTNEKIDTAKEELNLIQKDSDDATKKKSDLISNINALVTKSDTLDVDIQKKKSNSEKESKEKTEKADADLQKVLVAIEQAEKDLVAVERDKEAVDGQITAKTTEITVRGKELSELLGEIDKQDAILALNEEEIENHQKQVTSLKAEFKKLKENIDILSANKISLNAVIKAIEDEITALDVKVKQKKKQYEGETKRIMAISEHEDFVKQKELYGKERYERAGLKW